MIMIRTRKEERRNGGLKFVGALQVFCSPLVFRVIGSVPVRSEKPEMEHQTPSPGEVLAGDWRGQLVALEETIGTLR